MGAGRYMQLQYITCARLRYLSRVRCQNKEVSKFRRDQQVSGFQMCWAWTYSAVSSAVGFHYSLSDFSF